ncbi:MAG: peptidase S8 [Chloroflexi bacterium]|nr:peptidase S8 [Chloroflexota bacterium]
MSKKRYLWLIGLALLAVIQRSATSRADSYCTGTYAPGIILVGFRDDVSAAERKSGLNVTSTIPGIDVSTLRVPVGHECTALETLRSDPRITFAELDYAVRATDVITPNDPGWTNQWGPAKIQAPVAWDVITGTPDVVIAVLDSGVRLNHPDLVDNLWTNPGEIPNNGIDDDGNGKVDDFWGWHFYHEWNGQDFVPQEDNQVADDHGHGTHVTGIAAAKINNGVGIAGIAGGSRVMTVKVLDQYGDGWYSDIAQGIIYAVDNDAQIINLSLGAEPSSETLQEAVNYAHAHGVLVIAATGNDGGSVLYPAACEHVLSVAATDQNDEWPGFSNYGPQVDVAAPGVDIYSTWYTYYYFVRSGTSMATPHVSGLAALIWSAHPGLGAAQVTRIITSTAIDVNSGTLFTGWDEYLGWGRIDAGKALAYQYHYLPIVLHSGN